MDLNYFQKLINTCKNCTNYVRSIRDYYRTYSKKSSDVIAALSDAANQIYWASWDLPSGACVYDASQHVYDCYECINSMRIHDGRIIINDVDKTDEIFQVMGDSFNAAELYDKAFTALSENDTTQDVSNAFGQLISGMSYSGATYNVKEFLSSILSDSRFSTQEKVYQIMNSLGSDSVESSGSFSFTEIYDMTGTSPMILWAATVFNVDPQVIIENIKNVAGQILVGIAGIISTGANWLFNSILWVASKAAKLVDGEIYSTANESTRNTDMTISNGYMQFAFPSTNLGWSSFKSNYSLDSDRVDRFREWLNTHQFVKIDTPFFSIYIGGKGQTGAFGEHAIMRIYWKPVSYSDYMYLLNNDYSNLSIDQFLSQWAGFNGSADITDGIGAEGEAENFIKSIQRSQELASAWIKIANAAFSGTVDQLVGADFNSANIRNLFGKLPDVTGSNISNLTAWKVAHLLRSNPTSGSGVYEDDSLYRSSSWDCYLPNLNSGIISQVTPLYQFIVHYITNAAAHDWGEEIQVFCPYTNESSVAETFYTINTDTALVSAYGKMVKGLLIVAGATIATLYIFKTYKKLKASWYDLEAKIWAAYGSGDAATAQSLSRRQRLIGSLIGYNSTSNAMANSFGYIEIKKLIVGQ